MFIRTDEFVYKLISDLNTKRNNVKVDFGDTYGLIGKALIIKHAETIEELCDEFVWIKHLDDKTYRISYKKIDTKNKELLGDDNILHYTPRKELEIYGGIWTNKGFIFVAKLNEKGELELL